MSYGRPSMARVTAAEDGTIDVLDIHEARLMAAMDRNQSTPGQLAGQLTWTWQMVARVANRLKHIGLVRTDHYTKAVYYRLTPDGISLLPLIRERTTRSGRFLTGEALDALAAEAEAGYPLDRLRPVVCAACDRPALGYGRGVNGERLCHTDQRDCYRAYVAAGNQVVRT